MRKAHKEMYEKTTSQQGKQLLPKNKGMPCVAKQAFV